MPPCFPWGLYPCQGRLALVAGGCGVAAYLSTQEAQRKVLLGAALLTLSVWPYTHLAMTSTTHQLMDLDGDGMTFFKNVGSL